MGGDDVVSQEMEQRAKLQGSAMELIDQDDGLFDDAVVDRRMRLGAGIAGRPENRFLIPEMLNDIAD